jgi:hypothetical protein
MDQQQWLEKKKGKTWQQLVNKKKEDGNEK